MSKKVVIVGGGFAGVKAARELAGDSRFSVTLVSDREDFEYHAALYRSATGRSPLQVAVPLAEIFARTNVELLHDAVTTIDAIKKTVGTKGGKQLRYDELLLAPGAVTAYFGIKGLPEYSYNIKTIEEALRLKEHLHAELTEGHKPDLHYVVVGAGPSGVELAGELVSYLRRLRKNHRSDTPFHVDLVEAAPRILPTLPEVVSRKVEARLKQLGVNIYASTAVKGETAQSLQLPHGSIDTHTVIWTAGLTNDPLFADNKGLFTLGKGGKVEVDEYLGAGKGVWVLGDSAASAKTGWAQTAVYDGAYVAGNLKRAEAKQPLAEYAPPDPIGAIPVGPNWCAVSAGSTKLYGLVGWVVRRWSDLKLYRAVMPLRMALRSWIVGDKMTETCPNCR